MSAGKAAALVIGGALIGAGVTTLVLRKRYADQRDAQVEEEVTSVREAYLKRLNEIEEEYAHLDNIAAKKAPFVKEEPTLPQERVVPSNEQLYTAYHKMSKASPETVEGLSEVNETLGYSRKEDKVKIVSNETDPETPFVIPVQAYMDNEELFEQFVLTYYVGDHTLIYEDSDSVVEDVDQTVGFHNLKNFGVESGNNDTVYVRNPKKETEYEILRDEGKYNEAVQGIDTWDDSPEPRKPIRKFV